MSADRGLPAERADVCIVGAGAAGIVLAVELARAGSRVVMLEGGGRQLEDAAQEPYRSEVVGLAHRGVHTGRFRVVGGTTTKWGGQILELEERDFMQRAGVAESGWPISKAELLPYYARALELEGLGGVTRSDNEVWRKAKVEPPTFEQLDPYFSRWCPQPNFALLHGETLRTAPGLTLWLHANAVGLQMEGEHVTAVLARSLDGVERLFEADRFVFALGAIECTRFFLQPQPFAKGWNKSGLLGRHFQDHIDVNAAVVRPVDPKRFHRYFDNVFSGGYKYHPKLRLTVSAQQQFRTLNVAGTMVFESDTEEVLGEIKAVAKKLMRGQMREVAGTEFRTTLRNLPLLTRLAYRYVVKHRAYNPSKATIRLRVHCEQEPNSLSSIGLSEARDSLGLLRTRLDWQISPREVETIRDYVLVAQRSLASVAKVEPDEALLALDPEFRQRCDDSNHHMGGMRMAARQNDGIVDTDLLLYGTSNMYICSSAVFPTSGYSNPTHTLLALAVRLSRRLSSTSTRVERVGC